MMVKEEIESFKEVLENGDIEYRNKDSKLHREDGPAVEWETGDKFWYINGKIHREDGPALERANGDKFWYLNGKKLPEDDFLNWQLKNSKTVKLNFQ